MRGLPATRKLATGGMVAPWLWSAIVIVLTGLEFDTLTGFGWTPGASHGVNYPSSLALGRFGWAQMANFALFGLLMIFPTDTGPPNAPATWHGATHGIGFVTIFLPLLLAMFFLAVSSRGDSRWDAYVWLGPAVGAAALIAFIALAAILPASLDQVPFYLALFVLFVGITLIGLRVRSLNETLPAKT